MIKWIKDLWHRIVSSNDEPYINKIAELEWIIKQNKVGYDEALARIDELETELDNEITNYYEMKNQYESMQKTKNEILEELTSLKHEDPDFETPDFLDTSKLPYLPFAKFYYWDRRRNRAAKVTKRFTPSKFYRMWTDDMYTFFRNAVKDCKTFDEKVVKLRNVIVNRTKYESDLGINSDGKVRAGENWHMPLTTYYSKIGDCDSSTILWVTACHICGLPADRIFNATGVYKHVTRWIGHSWGVAKFDDGSWRVIENTSKRNPILFKNNKQYEIRGFLGGLSNWNLSGQSKKETF